MVEHNSSLNGISTRRYAKMKNADTVLEKNPGAKVFREAHLFINLQGVHITLGDVTREAAQGGYHNGVLNKEEIRITLDEFFTGDVLMNKLEGEPFSLVSTLLDFRARLGLIEGLKQTLSVIA